MSTRMEYNVEALREMIDDRHSDRIKKAHEDYDLAMDITGRRDRWRQVAEDRVLLLAARIKSPAGDPVTDAELSGFTIKNAPVIDRYFPPENNRDDAIRKAEQQHERSMRRLTAIDAKNGTLSLTPKMLSDLFDL